MLDHIEQELAFMRGPGSTRAVEWVKMTNAEFHVWLLRWTIGWTLAASLLGSVSAILRILVVQ